MWAFYRKFFVWEQRKLGDIATPIKTYSLTRAFETLKNTNFKYIHYGDIHTGKAKIIQNPSTLPTIKKNDNYITLKTNDIIIADASEDYKGIADAAILKDCGNYKIVAGLHTIAIRPNSCNVSSFIYILLGRDDFKHWGYKVGTGLKVFGITLKNFLKYKTFYPSLNEQKAISNLLNLVDNLLDLQKRKYEELKLLKKALLQNMFANKTAYPKLRFNGFNSKWKSYKLKEIGKIVTGNTPPTKDLNNYSDHGMLWVTPTDITGPIIRNTVKRLSPIGITKARTAKEGSILVTCIASIGKNALTETRCGFNQQINAVIPNQYNDSYFLLIQSKFWSKKAKQIAAKGTIKIVNKKDFSNLSFLYPKLKEQKNMSSFFKLLDMVTTFQMKNLIELKKIKHFLLQNMFI